MKILVINGSPKGQGSNSLRLTERFVQGVTAAEASAGHQASVEVLTISELQIAACKGCFACWKKTPGQCCIHDDMADVIAAELRADLIIWSFPLYYFNVPGILKNVIDRQLPMNLPFMSEREDGYGSGSHDARFDMSGKRHVLISTCGFYSAQDNYDSVIKMFDHFLGRGAYETIFCGQGELFRVKELSQRTDEYLAAVEQAGAEYAQGSILDATRQRLEQLLFPKEQYEAMADASWGVAKDGQTKDAETLIFTRQMAALYDRTSYAGVDRVLEMRYTDTGETYQIRLGESNAEVFTDGHLTPTTVIETPFTVWKQIGQGEIRGDVALAQGAYRVKGEFDLMLNWDRIFRSGQAGDHKTAERQTEPQDGLKPPSMTTMLIAWITLWIAVAINPKTGAVITLAVTALLPVIMRSHRFIFWDRLSIVAVAALSAIAFFTGNGDHTTLAGNLIFGLMWLISCFTREPLCAAYVKYGYGGDDALQNPLFMKTNVILAAAWGVMYVLKTFWTWGLSGIVAAMPLMVVNQLVPVAMGLFTIWFERWYPAKMARGWGDEKHC